MNTKWLIKNWFRVGRRISWKLSFETLFSLLYFIPIFKTDFIYKILERKNRYIFSFLNKNYHFLLEKYQNYKPITQKHDNRKIIWVMWWQGENVAPSIVKMCINSMRRNANGADVRVISKDNYSSYIEIPEYIIEKHNSGVISFAHLADIMRVFLIAKYGGLWLDSTIYVSKPIPDNLFNKSFYSLHSEHVETPFVADDRFYTFVMGGLPGSKVFMFERDFFSEYCRDCNAMLDYYLLDYSIMFQYFNLPDIKEMIDDLDVTSETLYSVVNMLNKPYNEEMLEKALNENLFSKLRWNGKHKLKNKNQKTNYAVLIEREGVLIQ